MSTRTWICALAASAGTWGLTAEAARGQPDAGTAPAPAAAPAKVPTLSIANLPEPTTTFVLDAPGTWRQELYVLADGEGEASLAGVVQVRKFQPAGGGAQVEATVSAPTPASVRHGGQASFTIEATFAAAATYATTLTLVSGGKTLSRVIEVQVKPAAAAAVAALPIEQLEPKAFARGVGAQTITLRIANTSDAPQTFSVDAAHASVHLLEGAQAKLATEATGAVVVPAGGARVTVPPRAAGTLDVALRGLEPGEYVGSVRIIGDRVAPTTMTFTVDARHHVGWAILCIVLGVLAGAGVVGWRDHFRKRKVLRIAIAQQRARLDPRAVQVETSLAQSVWRALDQMLVDLERTVALEGSGGTAETRLTDITKRIGLFTVFNDAANRIANLPPADQLTKRADLDKVAVLLRDPQATVDDARQKLSDLGIVAAERTALSTALETLAATIAELRRGGDPLLDKDLGPADDQLELARDALRRDAAAELRRHLDVARGHVATAGHDAIVRALDAAGRPAWARAEVWAAARDRLSRLAEKGDVVARYHKARDLYLRTAAAEALHAAAKVSPAPDGLAAAVTALKGASAPEATDLDNLSKRLRETVAFLQPPPAIAKAAPPDPHDVGRSSDHFAPFGRVPDAVDPAARIDDLTSGILRRDALVYLVVAIVAVLGGLKVLYAGNSTWGTTEDIITALVWGCGFKPIADGFIGVFGLRDAFGKP